MNNFNKNLLEFLRNGTCSFTCINQVKNILINYGYQELFENKNGI